jgi:hypothetical protein
MKAILFVLQAFVLVFFLGCQESNITDPGAINDNTSVVQGSYSDNFSAKDLISSYPRSIIVDQLIYDPTHPANGGDPIKGIIRYDHKLGLMPSTPSGNLYRVQIRLYLDLIIDANCPRNLEAMKSTGSSAETVDFAANTARVRSFEKVFIVRNTCCGPMNLVLKFETNTKDMKLVSVSLKKIFRPVQADNFGF